MYSYVAFVGANFGEGASGLMSAAHASEMPPKKRSRHGTLPSYAVGSSNTNLGRLFMLLALAVLRLHCMVLPAAVT